MFSRLLGRPSKTTRVRKPITYKSQLRLEALEARDVPAVFTVNTDVDWSLAQLNGMGVPLNSSTLQPVITTLRSAVELSNMTDDGTTNRIQFNTIPPDPSAPPITYVWSDGDIVSVSLFLPTVYLSGAHHTINFDHAKGTLTVARDVSIANTTGATITLDAAATEANTLRHITALASVAEFSVDSLEFVNGWANDDGGAIQAGQASVVIRNSKFVNDRSKTNGGAISNRQFNLIDGGDIVAIDCLFQNCTAILSGGAIYASGAVTNLTITDCEFDANVAGKGGGAIKFRGINCSVTGSSFWYNQAVDGDGGAIHFQPERAAPPAGSPYFTLDVLNTYFLGNYAQKGGGAIGTQGNGIATTVSCSDFHLNSADDEGGGIYCSGGAGGKLTVDGCYFLLNSATNGGAINNGSSAVSIYRDSRFISNTASGSGGALFVKNFRHEVSGCEFADNTASANKGPSIAYVGNPNVAPGAAGWLQLAINYASCTGLVAGDVQPG